MDTSLYFDDWDLLEEHYGSGPRQAPRRSRTASSGTRAPRSDIGKQHKKPIQKPSNPTSGRSAADYGRGIFSNVASAAAAAADEHQPEALQELLADLERLQQQSAYTFLGRVPTTNASERGEQQELKWQQQRGGLSLVYLQQQAGPADGATCMVCNEKDATVRCFSCNQACGPVLMCGMCDQDRHQYAHMHRRQAHDGCWRAVESVAPGSDDGVIRMKRASYRCSQCSANVWQWPEDFLQVGAWPASLDPVHLQTIVQQAVLDQYDTMKLHNPTLSMHGFLEGLAAFASVNNPLQAPRSISTQAFRRAHREYKCCQMDMRLYVMLLNDLDCPACSAGCEAVHLDGNFKLFTWSRSNREPWRQPYYDEFFSEDAEITNWMEALDLAVPPKGRASCADSVCNGTWTAAANAERRQAQQYYTGRYMAFDARHGLPIAAVNMIKTGERYGYALFLLFKRLMRMGVKQLHMDIVCKWGDWARSTVAALDLALTCDQRVLDLKQQVTAQKQEFGRLRCVLSEAHGMLHGPYCQILYMPSWNQDCGKTVGEEGEQGFSYLSRHCNVVRNMSIAGSVDYLTEAVFHLARVQNDRQAARLARRYKRFCEEKPKAQKKLAAMLELLSSTAPDSRPELVVQMKAELKELAHHNEKGPRNLNEKLLELCAVAQRAKDAAALQGLVIAGAVAAPLPQLRVPDHEAVAIAAGLSKEYSDALQLHQLAIKVIKQGDASARTEQLRREVAAAFNQDPSLTADALVIGLFEHIAEDSIIRLQNLMEGLCHQINKHAVKRDAKGALPKERNRQKARVKELSKQLQQKVDQYSKLIPYGRCQRPPTTLEELLHGRPHRWLHEYDTGPGVLSASSALRKYGVSVALQVCEADNAVLRVNEELSLLVKEMRAHIGYWQSTIDNQQRFAAVLQRALDPQCDVAQTAAAASVLYQAKQGRYLPTVEQLLSDKVAVSGAVGILAVAVSESQAKLHKAVSMFQHYISTSTSQQPRPPGQLSTDDEPTAAAEDTGCCSEVEDGVCSSDELATEENLEDVTDAMVWDSSSDEE